LPDKHIADVGYACVYLYSCSVSRYVAWRN